MQAIQSVQSEQPFPLEQQTQVLHSPQHAEPTRSGQLKRGPPSDERRPVTHSLYNREGSGMLVKQPEGDGESNSAKRQRNVAPFEG